MPDTVMVASTNPMTMVRTFAIRVQFEHYAYLSLSREEYAKAVKSQIEAASRSAYEMIMKDYDEPKSS